MAEIIRPIRNARFWDYVNNGLVKLTLRPDQELTHTSGGSTDEGWFSEVETWIHTGDGVEYTRKSWGRDCDGGYGTASVVFCPLADLGAGAAPEDVEEAYRIPDCAGVRYPSWRKQSACQYDEQAELAGY
jgi:hypothetical protein